MNRIITAKFASTCAETCKRISKGETILYNPGLKKAYCTASVAYANHNNDFSQAGAMAQANEDAFFDNWCIQNNI